MDNTQFTTSDLRSILESVLEQQNTNTKDLIHELRKPTPEQVLKAKADELKKLAKAEQSIKDAFEEEQSRMGQQATCGHQKKNWQTQFVGHVNSDGYVRFTCIRCQKQMPPVKAPQEWVTNGVNAQDPNNPFMWKLTEQQIEAWAKHTAEKFPLAPRVPRRMDLSTLPPEARAEVERIRQRRAELHTK